MQRTMTKCQLLFYKSTVNSYWLRTLSTKSHLLPDTRVREVNKNISLVVLTTPRPRPRPLVLLFGWLFARPQHLRKFTDMYVGHGFDVISVQVKLSQLLRPKVTQSLMMNVLDLCLEEERKSQPIIVHGLSVGGYLYAEVLTNLQKFPGKYFSVGQRLRCQIFDSVVDFHGIPRGISRAITRNEAIATKIAASLEWYLGNFKSTTDNYVKASKLFIDNELRLPSIFLYSLSDVVCSPEQMEGIMNDWRLKDIYVTSRCWQDAPHVCAFVKYNEEYTQTISEFIQKIRILEDEHEIVKEEVEIEPERVEASNVHV